MPDEACYADDIGDYRWEGFTLAQKHGWMQTGEGAAAVTPAVDALRQLSERLSQSDQNLRAELRTLGITWAGAASDAALTATDQLAEWVGGVGRTTAAGQGNVDTYGSSFAEMKPKIPPPVHIDKGSFGRMLDAASGGYAALVGLQTEYSRQVEAEHAANLQANAALDAHRDATRQALRTFPVAEAPPDPTVGTGSATTGATGPGAPAAGPGHGMSVGGPAAPHPRTGAVDPTPAATGTTSASAPERPIAPPADTHPAAPPAGTPAGPIAVGPLGAGGSGPAAAGSAPPRGYRPPLIRPAAPALAPGTAPGPVAGRYGDQGLPPRTGTPACPPQPPTVQERAATRGAVGPGLHGAPIGMGGALGGGAEHYHRNQTFIPSDEPFHVEFADVNPPVLGVRPEDEP